MPCRAVMTVSWFDSIAAMHCGLYQARLPMIPYMPMVPEHATLPLWHEPIQKPLINHLNNSNFGIDSLLGLLC